MTTLEQPKAETCANNEILLSPDRIDSAALRRIMAEVVDERDVALVANRYDRAHNRHNR
jgi:hypothetical protein